MKTSSTSRVAEVEESWHRQTASPSITEIADQNIAKAMATEEKIKAAELYHPYECHDRYPGGRKLEETVSQFLKRVPPATSQVRHGFPWIIIANPFVPRRPRRSESPSEGIDAEENRDLTALGSTLGMNLLEELTDDIAHATRELAGQVCANDNDRLW